jgi:tRNA A37 threonylcarbamoyladenosine dehydratase
MNCDEIYQRNHGFFTKAEQNRLKNAKVAIVGVGGVHLTQVMGFEGS